MATDYELRLAKADGTEFARISDFLALGYRKVANAAGLSTFTLRGDHRVIDDLEHRSQIEIWRRNRAQDLDWYCDFYGLYLDQERERPQRSLFTARCPGVVWLLGTRHVMWTSGYADRSTFSSTAAETIMKTLVDYNAAANATTGNGRIRDGTITGVSVEADGGNGNTLDWTCAWKNLLAELQDLAAVAGGDFDLIKTGDQAWEFRWYTDQRGTDRTSGSDAVTFSLYLGNMAEPVYRYDRIQERTVAVVAGQGRGPNRETVTRTGDAYSAGNDVEMFVDARNIEIGETSQLQDRGDRKLDEQMARQVLDFDVLQTPACAYGVHYCASGVLGDLVTANYLGIETTQKIVGVTVEIDENGRESIDVDMETQ